MRPRHFAFLHGRRLRHRGQFEVERSDGTLDLEAQIGGRLGRELEHLVAHLGNGLRGIWCRGGRGRALLLSEADRGDLLGRRLDGEWHADGVLFHFDSVIEPDRALEAAGAALIARARDRPRDGGGAGTGA
jgi:hypothetical protein